MIKTKTFVVETEATLRGTNNAAEQLDDMIEKFIEEKTYRCTSRCTSFNVINIQYSPTIVAVGERLQYWYPSAMIVYDEA